MQFFTFFMMFSSGWMLGIIFDVYRVVTRPLKLSRLSFSVLDLMYWLIATVLVFKMLYSSNHGELRFFVFLGLLLGTWFYYAYVSQYTVITIKQLMKIVKWTVNMGIRCIQLLVIQPIRLVYKFIVFLLGIFIAMAIFLFKVMVQLLYPFWSIGRWIGKLIPWPTWLIKSTRWIKHQAKRFFESSNREE